MIGGATATFFQAMFLGAIAEKITGKKVRCLEAKMNTDDLKQISEWLTAGKIKPIIDREFQLKDIPAAIAYLEQRQVKGKVSILIP